LTLRKFNGGKGVLCSIVWLIAIMPKYSWIALVIAAIYTLISGYLNMGGVIFPIIAIPIGFIFMGIEYGIFMILASIMMIIRNINDIKTTLKGEYTRTYPLKSLDKRY